jgi:sugar phosphate isomerase/epimerase
MKKILLFLFLWISFFGGYAQKVRNPFFALHNIVRGDSAYDTFDKQVHLIKTAGFDAIEINQVENFEAMHTAIERNRFRGSYFYVKVKLEEPYFEQGLENCIQRLKSTKVIIAPYFVSESKNHKPSAHDADTLAVKLLHKLGDMARKSGLEVAIYPHYGFYVERTDHALALCRQANRKNIGMTFNLCHWLATTSMDERAGLTGHLAELRPYLKMITISGANDVVSGKRVIWDDYILPLCTGSFDTFSLVRYLIRELRFQGPIGVQCYNIKGNRELLVRNTIACWRSYEARME